MKSNPCRTLLYPCPVLLRWRGRPCFVIKRIMAKSCLIWWKGSRPVRSCICAWKRSWWVGKFIENDEWKWKHLNGSHSKHPDIHSCCGRGRIHIVLVVDIDHQLICHPACTSGASSGKARHLQYPGETKIGDTGFEFIIYENVALLQYKQWKCGMTEACLLPWYHCGQSLWAENGGGMLDLQQPGISGNSNGTWVKWQDFAEQWAKRLTSCNLLSVTTRPKKLLLKTGEFRRRAFAEGTKGIWFE